MEFSVRASSAAQHWNGFEAFLYDASAGVSEQEFLRYNVSMQVGRPLMVASSCDGKSVRRLQIPGDVKIVPPGITRVWETESATTKLSMYLSPSLIYSTAETMGVNPDHVTIGPQLHVRDARIEHIGWAVKAELESSEPLDRLYGESLGVALATHLLRSYPAAPRAGSLSRRRLMRVLDFVQENLAGDLSLSTLAGVAGVGPSHFKALFRESLGMPVHQYVMRRRVEFAAELAQRRGAALADIAAQAGFADQSHMARCMRRFMGVTPSTLRG